MTEKFNKDRNLEKKSRIKLGKNLTGLEAGRDSRPNKNEDDETYNTERLRILMTTGTAA